MPMNFLSLAPVGSGSHSQQTVAKSPTNAASVSTVEHLILRANSTSSESSDTSNSGAKQMRFLKLGHSDGDWSEEVIDAWSPTVTEF